MPESKELPDSVGIRRFWWEAIKHAFTKAWIGALAMSGVLAIVVPCARLISGNPSYQAFFDILEKYWIGWILIAVFSLMLLGRLCYAPFLIYKQIEAKRAELQRKLDSLLAAREEERPEVVALRGLKLHYFDGLKVEAEIIGFPGRRATGADWDGVERWWRSAVTALSRKVFSQFLPPGDVTSLDELEDDEIHGGICVRLTGNSPAAEERLCKCIRARLERVGELTAKLKAKSSRLHQLPIRQLRRSNQLRECVSKNVFVLLLIVKAAQSQLSISGRAMNKGER